MSAIKREGTDFWKPSVAADLVIFCNTFGAHNVLLIRRGKEPFKGSLAFPGGFLDENDEDLMACAVRELQEETGLKLASNIELRQLPVRSAMNRDPRQNRVISVPFLGIIEGMPEVVGADDAVSAQWIPVDWLSESDLAFDHWQTLMVAIRMVHSA